MKSSEHPNYIVPLNLAKELKRIGFKDKVNFYYSFHISDRGVHITGVPENMNKKYYSGKYISLPCYEQVFSWFRRKGFYITLESHRENTKFTFYNMEVDKGKHFKGDFKRYETARYNLVSKLIEVYKITDNILGS